MLGIRKKKKIERDPRHKRMFREAFLEEKKRKRPRHVVDAPKFSWWIAALWILFLMTVFFTLLFSDFDRVGNISVSGLRDIPEERLTGFIRDELSTPVFRFVSGDNFFLLRQDVLEADILRMFPKLASVSVVKRFPDRLDVRVSERERICLFCSSGACFLPDGDGYAQDAWAAFESENDPYILRMEDESGKAVQVGEYLFPGDFAESVLAIDRGIREDAGIPLQATVTTPARVSRELHFRTEAGWEIFVSMDIAPVKTVETLRLILDKELPEEKRANLRYIDLRTDGRVFYAKNDQSPPTDATVAPTNPVTDASAPPATPADTGAKKTDVKKK
ncbi:MAG: FtsQ-type POTRA domain-containing protein [Candidatus Moraniibacteriota bacterium]